MRRRISPREVLIEAAATAHRARDVAGRILPAADWMDLSPADREKAFELQLAWRRLERDLDPDGLSATGWTVIDKTRRLRQLDRPERS